MSKWLIVSDNHTEAGILYQLYEQHKDADAFIHLGDSEFEYNDTELSLFRRVKGNCDFYPEFPNEEIVEVNGVKAFYGHTHVAKYEELGDVHVINPGSISQSRSNIEETFAELLIDDDRHATLHFRNRDNQIIDTIEFRI